jgi:hypothetical protein
LAVTLSLAVLSHSNNAEAGEGDFLTAKHAKYAKGEGRWISPLGCSSAWKMIRYLFLRLFFLVSFPDSNDAETGEGIF